MTTQVIFTVDKTLKNRALRKAKAQGISFADVLNLATKAFVDGSFGMRFTEEGHTLDGVAKKRLENALHDIKIAKRLSPEFTDVEDAMRFLKQKT